MFFFVNLECNKHSRCKPQTILQWALASGQAPHVLGDDEGIFAYGRPKLLHDGCGKRTGMLRVLKVPAPEDLHLFAFNVRKKEQIT